MLAMGALCAGAATTAKLVPGGDYYIADSFARALRFSIQGYQGSDTLRDFPVLVRLAEGKMPGFKYDDFHLADGRDLVFLDSEGNIIPHEIDTWNPDGESLIWVCVPEVKIGSYFSMCYRCCLARVPDITEK
ncbi:MAG: hypothetical protein ACI4RA_03000, partial [Kiritimatiellia bacterium]